MTATLEVTKQLVGEQVHVQIKGRLDSSWADHLAAALDEVVRGDCHDVLLDMAEVTYLSSAGIRVLTRSYKQLHSIRGSLVVVQFSEVVQEILTTVGLKKLLRTAGETGASIVSPGQEARAGEKQNIGAASYEIYRDKGHAPLSCRLVGDVRPLHTAQYGPQNCRAIRFPPQSFGLGLGALGNDFTDCQNRFGEFLAAAGAAAYLPTDGSNRPDYLLGEESFAPTLQVCYGVVCEGPLPILTRFQASTDVPAALSQVVESCLQISGCNSIGMVMAAETAGLVGAALRRSPSLPAQTDPLSFPDMRNWLTFTAEPAFRNSSVLVVGVAGSADAGPLTPLVRPLTRGGACWGHFHAAAFSYRPLARGLIDCQSTLAHMFKHQTLQGILHLLADERAVIGVGQSEFIRGACWFGPLPASEVRTEE